MERERQKETTNQSSGYLRFSAMKGTTEMLKGPIQGVDPESKNFEGHIGRNRQGITDRPRLILHLLAENTLVDQNLLALLPGAITFTKNLP